MGGLAKWWAWACCWAVAAAGCAGGGQVRGDGGGPAQREGYVDVPGGKVWYRAVGVDRPGAPLLVVHGGPGVPSDYLFNLAALADERPVIFYDQLGCGNSDKPVGRELLTVGRFVEELEAVRTSLAPGRVFVLGQSWGSMLAAAWMLEKRPAGVAGLVMSGPFLSGPRFVADQRAWLREMPEAVRRVIEEKEAARDYASPEYQEAMMAYYGRHVCRMAPWPDLLTASFTRMAADVYGFMWGPSEFTCTGVLCGEDFVPRLREIEAPALFTCGEFDEATPETTRAYAAAWPGAEALVLDGASHVHHLERSAEYLAAVRGFLRRAEAGK